MLLGWCDDLGDFYNFFLHFLIISWAAFLISRSEPLKPENLCGSGDQYLLHIHISDANRILKKQKVMQK